MNKREPRPHLDFESELSSPQPTRKGRNLNVHATDHLPGLDQRQDRKRIRQHLHLLEGGGFDPEDAGEIADAA